MKSAAWTTVVGVTPVMILGPNPHRTALTLSGDSANVFTVNYSPPGGLADGWTVTPPQNVVKLHYDDVGDRIRGPIYALCSSAGGTLHAVESFL